MVSPAQPPLQKRIATAAQELLDRLGTRPGIAMLLGAGHASIAAQLEDRVSLGYADLPAGLRLSDESHLHGGVLEGVPVVVGDAPLAPYEGHHAMDTVFPVRVLQACGAELLVLTAGAASLTPHFEAGTVVAIEDHLNFSGIHPLQGPPEADLGPRFPDMSEPYAVRWRTLAREVAAEIGLTLPSGVFAAVPGPSLPTRAEYRFLRRAGADLVGMSLVPEVLAAVHCGIDVLALVGVTQVHVEGSRPADIEDLLDAADVAAPRMASILTGVTARVRDA